MSNSFRLYSPAGNELEIIPNAPDHLLPYKLPASITDVVHGRFGYLGFHNYKGNGFNIWLSHICTQYDTVILGSSDQELIEFHSFYKNYFATSWDGLKHEGKFEGQHNVTYAPDANTRAEFKAGCSYMTFDIHFEKPLMVEFANDYPVLYEFVNKTERKKHFRLLPQDECLTWKMKDLIDDIINYDHPLSRVHSFFEWHVHELLMVLLKKAGSAQQEYYTPYEKECAHAARSIMVADFTKEPNIRELATTVGLSHSKLQQCFKYFFSTSMYKYFRTEKLRAAKQMLLNPTYDILDVSIAMGYPDKQNFHNAFKKEFKITPADWRLRNGIKSIRKK